MPASSSSSSSSCVVVVLVVAGLGGLGGRGGLLLRAAGLLLGARRLGGLELGGDQRVVLGAQVDLVVEVAAAGAGSQRAVGVAVGHEVVLLLNASICWTVTSS